MRFRRVGAEDEDDVDASSISRIEPDAALVFMARCIAATDDEWQSRVQ